MRHGSVNRRSRSRGRNGPRSGNQRMQVFDSNGPDVRIRGTAYQVAEKYEALAKDAASAGDKILAESYLQYAEHYHRIIGSWGDAPSDRENASGNSHSYNQDQDDDLSLPASILGNEAKAERTQTVETEKAGA